MSANSAILASQWPALHSLDLGSVISPDGRDTPLLHSMTVNVAPSVDSADNVDSKATSVTTTNALLPDVLPKLPEHFGARVAVGIIAVVVIVIVAWRILAPPPEAAALLV